MQNLKDQADNIAKSEALIRCGCATYSVMVCSILALDIRYMRRERYKNCPKCNHALEKEGGCDHFMCGTALGCKAEFCHECLADYDEIRRLGNR